MLSNKDAGPLLIGLLLVLVGTPAVVWLYAHQETALPVVEGATWKLGLLLAAQPFMYGFWLWLKRRSGPFTIEREDGAGRWTSMATTNSLKEAKVLAHDQFRRVLNLDGDIIYRGCRHE